MRDDFEHCTVGLRGRQAAVKITLRSILECFGFSCLIKFLKVPFGSFKASSVVVKQQKRLLQNHLWLKEVL